MIFGILLKTGRNEVLPYLLPTSSLTPWMVVQPPCVSLPRSGLSNKLAHVATFSVKFLHSPRFTHKRCGGALCVCVMFCVLCVVCRVSGVVSRVSCLFLTTIDEMCMSTTVTNLPKKPSNALKEEFNAISVTSH